MSNNGHNGNGELQPSHASEFNKTVVVTLPAAGLNVRIRAFDMTILTVLGRIPDGLTPIVSKVIEETLNGSNKASVLGEISKLDRIQRYQRSLEIAAMACQYAFVEPRIVDHPREGENEISIDMIHPNDRMYVYNFLGVPAHKLESFRDEQARNVSALYAESATGDGQAEPDSAPV